MAAHWKVGLFFFVALLVLANAKFYRGPHKPKALVCGRVSKLGLPHLDPEYLSEVVISVLEFPKWAGVSTDVDGYFNFKAPQKHRITIVAKKKGFKTTQFATVIVPHHGLCDKSELSIQMPDYATFKLLKTLRQEKIEHGRCLVMTTIQGAQVEGAHASLTTAGGLVVANTFYLGNLPYVQVNGLKTLDASQKAVSGSGQVLFTNVMPNNSPEDVYFLRVFKDELQFSRTSMIHCPNIKSKKTVFINVGAPFAPRIVTAN